MNKYQVLLDELNEGRAVLVAGDEHGIPTIHDVGGRLKTDGEVRHAGFGLFLADVGGKDVSFDGGGAMRRSDDLSWTPLRATSAQLASMGYDVEKVKGIVEILIKKDG